MAGAFSMAAGEYISMQSQRELFENQIDREREEMRVMPEVEREELTQIYRAKGLPQAEAQRVADRLMEDPEKALDTMVREELGLDPDELGSPWGAASTRSSPSVSAHSCRCCRSCSRPAAWRLEAPSSSRSLPYSRSAPPSAS